MNGKMAALALVAVAQDLLATYPDSSPTEQDRKKWREQAEVRRRKEGIRPRKAGEIRWYVTNVGVESVYITAGEFDSDQYTSGQLEAMGRKAIMEPLRRLEAELDKIGLRVTRSDVSVGMRHTGLGYGKGPLVLMASFNFEEKRVDRRLVDQAVKKVFG